ncbi:VOC family protein [Pseudonocardia xishanensis]|uniref:VOC family protein n=1 Tax=Pseudonocardia xishanensis TaxID=630995 RepID=A0ABP8RVD0_9PSEU
MASLSKEQIEGRKAVQVAFIVDNLEEAALNWARTVGAGPFFLARELPVSNVRRPNGEHAEFEQGIALGQWGSVMVELIEVRKAAPAIVHEVMTTPGFNHIAYLAADPEAEAARLVESGAPVLLTLEFGGVPVHFHDARHTTGFVIEHYPYVDAIEQTYGLVADAAEGWDGSDPLRVLGG